MDTQAYRVAVLLTLNDQLSKNLAKIGTDAKELGGKFDAINKSILAIKKSLYKKFNWDNNPPSDKYFKELFRISKNQIIWGANYFRMPPTKSFIVWRNLKFQKICLFQC